MRQVVLIAIILFVFAIFGLVRVANGQRDNSAQAFEHHHRELTFSIRPGDLTIPIQLPVAFKPVRLDLAFTNSVKGGILVSWTNSLTAVYEPSAAAYGAAHFHGPANLLPTSPCAYVDVSTYSQIDSKGVLNLKLRNQCDSGSEPQLRVTMWY